MSFDDRAVGAFLGLALGDSYGRELEFISGESVRRAPVDFTPGNFKPTDDTYMSIYLAKAMLDISEYSEDAFGTAVGWRFVEWSRDPVTPTTAPGITCLRGTSNFLQHRDWRTSGIIESDGCGAVMRICPLAIRYSGEQLVSAARISAQVTHAHPNALDTAVAASMLLEKVLAEGTFTIEQVQEVSKVFPLESSVRKALEAAITQSGNPSEWLDETSIPDGDGGWRSPSALGLAVYAVLAYQDQGFEVVVDKAARIYGDSDSVACLAGMLYGAAHGAHSLPGDWLSILEEREEITDYVQCLLELS